MNRNSIGRAALAALPFLLALAADLLLFATRRDRLPEQLASHFVGNGRADDYAGQTSYVVLTTLVLLGIGLLAVLMVALGTFTRRSHRTTLGFTYAIAGFLGYLLAALLLINVDAVEDAQGRGQDVTFPLWHLAAALGVGVAAYGLGLLAAALLPVPEASGDDGPQGRGEGPRIALRPGEVAGWARSAGSWPLPLAALLLLGTGVLLVFTSGWPIAVPALVLGLLIAAFARPHVTVDRRGITVSGLLPRPRVRVPLDRIEAASSREMKPLGDYGGWGYRVRPGRTGVMIRSGEGIVARLAGGRDFEVTVDDSATAAALLNTLIDQRRTDH
ncbi:MULTISPECIES: DUF1648 domain-containing protein [unclassified Streptomyces]|uniref:DUF1648 domain-containing protein n=1 Tax=unclassified Streptomyces TaxID=2593676 RepID=UPI000DAB5772|nr:MULTISPECIES: DUF1648 domain-containing protein [unclassified Streptomyces]PZT76587.1 DUF1648 domain-containing protein [Streptomyces sp. AC1-42W]PZT79455.1 DUF1648 domain-containing protein [Streptomyces sp. AC1-42T]